MEPIISFLKRRLREAGAARWELIAADAGVAKTLPRKIACNDRDNPGVQTIQPLLDYFRLVDLGERKLPELPSAAPAPAPQEAA
ncbi:MAG: hypothetical protein ACN6PP_00685 [Delftia tsuruhatensis]|jgi:hypothetical protein